MPLRCARIWTARARRPLYRSRGGGGHAPERRAGGGGSRGRAGADEAPGSRISFWVGGPSAGLRRAWPPGAPPPRGPPEPALPSPTRPGASATPALPVTPAAPATAVPPPALGQTGASAALVRRRPWVRSPRRACRGNRRSPFRTRVCFGKLPKLRSSRRAIRDTFLSATWFTCGSGSRGPGVLRAPGGPFVPPTPQARSCGCARGLCPFQCHVSERGRLTLAAPRRSPVETGPEQGLSKV